MTLSDLVNSPHLRRQRRWRGALRLADVEGLTPEQIARLREDGWLLPMAGADGEDDDAGDDDADADADGDDDDADGGAGGGGDDESSTVSKAEADALKMRLAEADRERRQLKKQLDKRKRAEGEEAGEYERLYRESQEELDRVRGEVRTNELNRAITEAARAANFRNPQIAVSLVDLPDDTEPDDVKEIERAVKRLAKKEGYLLKSDRPQGPDAGRGDADTRQRREEQRSDDDDRDRNGGSDDDNVFGVGRLRRYHAAAENEAAGRT